MGNKNFVNSITSVVMCVTELFATPEKEVSAAVFGTHHPTRDRIAERHSKKEERERRGGKERRREGRR